MVRKAHTTGQLRLLRMLASHNASFRLPGHPAAEREAVIGRHGTDHSI